MGEQPSSTVNDHGFQQARRRLLKLGVYAPPVILGAFVLAGRDAEAAVVGQTQNCNNGTITISANGTACCPCVPGPNYNLNQCLWNRCQLGSCNGCISYATNRVNQGRRLSDNQCVQIASVCGLATANGFRGCNCRTRRNGSLNC